jgi:hypothetical protein
MEKIEPSNINADKDNEEEELEFSPEERAVNKYKYKF